MGLVDRIHDAVRAHAPLDGWTQWYVDDFAIDCNAEEFWNVVEKVILQEGQVTDDISPQQRDSIKEELMREILAEMKARTNPEPEPSTPRVEIDENDPAVIKRKQQIAVHEELIEAQKAFHLKTAAYVMSMDHYKRVRAALSEAPNDVEDPEDPWQPVQGDMLNGYPVMVVEGEDIPPHIEMVAQDLRPSYYAGVTSLGVERKDMSPPPFEAAEMPGQMVSDEVLEALRRKLMGEPDEAAAETSVPAGHEGEAQDESPAQPES